jgi:hypothetical protein
MSTSVDQDVEGSTPLLAPLYMEPASRLVSVFLG